MITVGMTLRSVQNRSVLDGIGVYTQGIQQELELTSDINTVQIDKPVLGRVHIYPVNLLLSLVSPTDLNVNLVHFTDYRVFKTSCPSVVTIHDAIPVLHPEWTRSNFRQFKNLLLQRALNLCDRVIAVSNFAVKEIVDCYKVNPSSIVEVPCFLGRKWEEPFSVDREILAQYGIDRPFFLMVGTIQPRKNYLRTLEAFLSLPPPVQKNFILVIIGKYGWGDSELLTFYRRYKGTTNQNVRIIDSLNSLTSLRTLYKLSSGLIFPSLYEGFGIPILEAFASRIPVVTSISCSMPEVAGNAAIYVDPYSVESIREGFKRLISLTCKEKELLCLRGHERLQKYNRVDAMKKLKELYREMLI